MNLRLKNREIYQDGLVKYTETGLVDLLYSNGSFPETISFDNTIDVDLFNEWSDYFKTNNRIASAEGIDHKSNQNTWYMPPEYYQIDLVSFFAGKCKTETELVRVAEELVLFRERDMENLLRFLIFLVDFMEENKIVYGVGRGSSVASYCLYLIGINKIDPIKYDIDIQEFLR